MGSRHRSSGDARSNSSISLPPSRIPSDSSMRGYEMYSSDCRSFSRGYGRILSKQLPALQPPNLHAPCRNDIFLEAGRLAAEYLVSQGLLPPGSLNFKLQNGNYQDFKNHEREGPRPSSDGRISALSRLGSAVSDLSPGKKRFADEYGSLALKTHAKGRKRSKSSTSYTSEWDRENGRSVSWFEKSGSYLERTEHDADPRAKPRSERRSGFDVGAHNQAATEEIVSKSETAGDSGADQETCESHADADSNANSSSVHEESIDPNLKKGRGESDNLKVKAGPQLGRAGILNGEAEQVKPAISEGQLVEEFEAVEDLNNQANSMEPRKCFSTGSGDVNVSTNIHKQTEDIEMEKKTDSAEASEQSVQKVATNRPDERDGSRFLYHFGKIPTKPRSLLTSRQVKVNRESCKQEKIISDANTPRELRLSPDVELMQSVSTNSPSHNTNKLVCSLSEVLGGSISEVITGTGDDITLDVLKKEKIESISSLLNGCLLTKQSLQKAECEPGDCRFMDISANKADFSQLDGNKQVEIRKVGEQVPASSDNLLQNAKGKVLLVHDERTADPGEEIVSEVALVPCDGDCKTPGSGVENTCVTNSFKVCDLNLTDAYGVPECLHDSMLANITSSVSAFENKNRTQFHIGPDMGNGLRILDNFGGQSSGMKETHMLDAPIENAPLAEDKNLMQSEIKREHVYPNLEKFLDPPETSVDLTSIQDGYGCAFSQYLNSSVPPDIADLQNSISLHSQEGIHDGVDDAIYLSLGEIPLSFLGVWDHTGQEYGKHF